MLGYISLVVSIGAMGVAVWAAVEARRANSRADATSWYIDATSAPPLPDQASTQRIKFQVLNVGEGTPRDVQLVLAFDPEEVAHGSHHWPVVTKGEPRAFTLAMPTLALLDPSRPAMRVATITWTDRAGKRLTEQARITYRSEADTSANDDSRGE